MTEGRSTGGEDSDLAAVRLAQEIRRRRTADGLSQPDLAAMIGYTPSTCRWSSGPARACRQQT